MSPSSVAVAELVAMFLEGLKERSVFTMALQDRKATGAQPGGDQGVARGLMLWSGGRWPAHPHVSAAIRQGSGRDPSREREQGLQSTVGGSFGQSPPFYMGLCRGGL